MQQLSLSIIFECFGFHAIVSLGSSHKFPQVCYLKITMFVAQNVFQLGSTTLSIGQIRNTLLVSSVFEGIFFRAIVLSNIPCCVLVKTKSFMLEICFFQLVAHNALHSSEAYQTKQSSGPAIFDFVAFYHIKYWIDP